MMTTTTMMTNDALAFLVVLAVAVLLRSERVSAQSSGQFNEPPNSRRSQTYRVLTYEEGSINQRFRGVLRYYCTFRGKWSEERHPRDFPKSPSFSPPIMVAHSNGYRMWTIGEAATLGVEAIAEEGFTTILNKEFNNGGFETLQMVQGERMFNTTESQHLPPINVTYEHPFLSMMTKFTPSPDWFGGFSDLRVISYERETFYNRIVIHSFVWDAGTDAGNSYTALDRDMDPQGTVQKFDKNNIPHRKPFLSPDETEIPHPIEIECVLRVGEGSVMPGVPFEESQIRPPLYVPRPNDDFVNGMETHNYLSKNGKGAKGNGRSAAPPGGWKPALFAALLATAVASWRAV